MPSFMAISSTEVYRVVGDGTLDWVAVRIHWDRHRDESRIAGSVSSPRNAGALDPTMVREEVLMATEVAHGIEAALEELPFRQCLQSPTMGMDGTTYELTIGDVDSGFRLSWWCEPPDEWESAVRLADLVFASVPRTHFWL